MGLRPRRVIARDVDASCFARHARVRVVHAVVLQAQHGIAVRVAPERVVSCDIRRTRGASGARAVDNSLVSRAPASCVPGTERVIPSRARRSAGTCHALQRLDAKVHRTRAVGLRPRRIIARAVDASCCARHARVLIVHAVVLRARLEQSSTAPDTRSRVRGPRPYAVVPWKGGLPVRRRQAGQRESERVNRHADSCRQFERGAIVSGTGWTRRLKTGNGNVEETHPELRAGDPIAADACLSCLGPAAPRAREGMNVLRSRNTIFEKVGQEPRR